MVENKYVFYGLIAGAITGVVLGVSFLSITGTLNELVREIIVYQLTAANAPQEVIDETLAEIGNLMSYIIWIAPPAYVFQMLILGALFGALESFIINRFKLNASVAAILTGGVFIITLTVLPMAVLTYIEPKMVSIILKHINLAFILMPGIVYTTLLTIFSGVKGPWSKVKEETISP